MAANAEIIEYPIEQLKGHPRQNEFFDPTNDQELRELASDILRRGQQETVHIMFDGTIVRGHRRTAAAKLLGWKTIKAVIRHDLTDPDCPAAIDELISDNIQRRQLDDLALARCYHELKREFDDKALAKGETSRDVLAARLNCGKSGRTLDRLLRLLDLPRDIQQMVSDGRLNRSQAEKILKLSEKRRNAIYRELRASADVDVTLRENGIGTPRNEKSLPELGEELLHFFKQNLPALASDIKALDRLQVHGRDVVELLDEATEFVESFRDRKRMLAQQTLQEFNL